MPSYKPEFEARTKMSTNSSFLGNALSKIKGVHEGSGPKEDEVPAAEARTTEGGGETGVVPVDALVVEEEEIEEQLNFLREEEEEG